MLPSTRQSSQPKRHVDQFSHIAQLTTECRHACPGMSFLIKMPHLIHVSLGPPDSITQTASRSVQPFLHSFFTMCRPFSPKAALSHKLCGPHLGLHGSLGPPESTTQTACRSDQPFCKAHGSVPIFYNGCPFPPKLFFTWGPGPNLLRGSMNPLQPTTQTASSAVQLFFAGLTTVTDRPTDHAARSVTIGRIYTYVVWRYGLKTDLNHSNKKSRSVKLCYY